MTEIKDVIKFFTKIFKSVWFWCSLGIINFLIIVFRLMIRQNKFNFELLFFIAFLQLQIIACYILLLMTTPILYILYKLISLFIQYLILLFSKRTTNKFMKWLTLVITDNVIYRLWNIFVLYCLSQIIYYGIKYYIILVFWIGTFLLGYTEI